MIRTTALLALAVGLLAACEDDEAGNNGAANLGASFLNAFNASPTSDPVDAQTVTFPNPAPTEPFDP